MARSLLRSLRRWGGFRVALAAVVFVAVGAWFGAVNSPSAARGSERRGEASLRALATASGHKHGGPCRGRRPRRTSLHVVWIVFENHSYSQVIGSADAPYINRLARVCGLATNFHAESHPSLPNYIAMTSGSTQNISDDDDPSAHPLSVPSIFSQLGKHWAALDESMPSDCHLTSDGLYAVRHNPAAYYTNIRGRCRHQNRPLGGRPRIAARFTFVTPNLCNDMHDCSVATGDKWLSRFLPKLLRSGQYRTGRAVIFITWDEGSDSQQIPTLVVSRSVRPGTRARASFDHYSLLRTSEQLLGRGYLGRAASARSMAGAFHLR